MLIDGISLTEGSSLENAAIASGNTFPANADIGELFYLNVVPVGLHIYSGGSWLLITVAGLAQEFMNAQTFAATTLTDAANIAWDLSTNQVTEVTLAGNRVLDNPTNMKNGGVYIMTVKQDGVGSRTLSYDTAYKWSDGIAPVISTDPSAVDVLTFISDGTVMRGVAHQTFA